ncbi:hypothetical protein C8R45DRAFT_293991 [Mycena sanguinolenta]|nr:hypothetical protein C8R45DRAFT_293991 [Mycena sanguinolenta]
MAGVDLLFGPMLIGVVLNMMLYGVVVTQIIAYYQRYPNDSAWIRYFMLYLLLVQTANVVVEFGIIYQPLIIQYGTQAAMAVSPKLLPGDSVLISLVAAPIQMFTAWRISVITSSYILPGLIVLLSLCSFGSGMTVSTEVFLHPEFRNFNSFTSEVIVWLVMSATCDLVIALGMSYSLYSRKTKSNFVVDNKINRIIRLTLETGSLTAVLALADVALFLIFPATTANFIVDFPLSAVYTCSILAMLNSREPRKSGDAEQGRTASEKLTQGQTILKPPAIFQTSKLDGDCTFHGSKMVRDPTTSVVIFSLLSDPYSSADWLMVV